MGVCRQAYQWSARLNSDHGDAENHAIDQQNLSDLELLAGHFPAVLIHSAEAVFGFRAASHSGLGNVAAARADFARAADTCRIHHRSGDFPGALSQTRLIASLRGNG